MIPADGHEYWPDCHNESECLRTTCESWTWTTGLKGACCGKDWVTVLVDVDGEKAIDLVPAKKRKAAP